MAPLIECRDLTVRFGGVEALSNLSLEINEGEILGIAGPNGAGKTTLFNVVSGHVKPTSGLVRFGDREITGLAPHEIFQRGVARTFQLAQVIATQRTYTNVLVGAHFAVDTRIATKLAFWRESYAAADGAVQRFGLAAKASAEASTASLYERKMIMLASAMAHTPKVLLLDEPVGGLNSSEADDMLKQVRAIADQGTTVVVIEHVMRVLTTVAQRLVILNRGQVLFDGLPDEARQNDDVQRLYLGIIA